MQHMTASLRLWLKQQCQALGKVKSALLVNMSQATPQILAKWPDTSAKNETLLDAFKHLRKKKRLHLAITKEGELVLAQPLIIEGRLWGGLILGLGSCDKKEVPGILKTLQVGQLWLQLLLHDFAPQAKAETPLLPPHLSDLLLAIHARLLKENSLQEMTISLVNILATELKAARVSLGLLRAQTCTLEAVSFSASFDRRTAAMGAIVDTMLEAIEHGAGILYPSPVIEGDATPPGVTLAHQQLLRMQHVQRVQTVLLRKNERVVGAVTLEFHGPGGVNPSSDFPGFKEEQEFLTQALTLATYLMDLRLQAEAGVGQALLHRIALGLQRRLGHARWKIKIAGLAVAVFLGLLFVPYDYSVSGDANLQSNEKHLVVSPYDAYLAAIDARPGDKVLKGQLLAQLKDDDLRLERRKLMSQVQQTRQAYDTALANANRVESAIADAQLEQANIQLRLIEQQLERTQLHAPIDGLVVSDDISQTLGAPVKQGEVLFEIAALQGFLVQLLIDERDIAAVVVGQAGRIKLTSLPNENFNIRIKAITPLSEVREGRNYFRVEAELIGESPILRPGMSGSAKISVGHRSLGWIWFHDLWYWLRLKVW